MSLDTIDLRILRELQQDARVRRVQLAGCDQAELVVVDLVVAQDLTHRQVGAAHHYHAALRGRRDRIERGGGHVAVADAGDHEALVAVRDRRVDWLSAVVLALFAIACSFPGNRAIDWLAREGYDCLAMARDEVLDNFAIGRITPEAIAAETAIRAGRPEAGIKPPTPDLDKEHLTEWAQGKSGEIYPENVGNLLMPGTKLGFQTHYHAVGEAITDTMEMGWWFHPKGKTPQYSADYVTLGGGLSIEIPPNTVTEHQGMTVLKAPTILHNFQPHMHYRGKVQTLEAIYPDGRRETINQVSHFDNAWHINYIYDPDHAPIFPKGTVLIVTSIHDNTANNKNNPDPRQWVTWGERTVDEMAHLNQQLIYVTEDDYRRIVEERKKRTSVSQP